MDIMNLRTRANVVLPKQWNFVSMKVNESAENVTLNAQNFIFKHDS